MSEQPTLFPSYGEENGPTQSQLPPGWKTLKLGELGKWSSGGTPSRKTQGYYGGSILWAKIGDLNDGPILDTEETITDVGFENSSTKLVQPNTLLLAMYGASIGKLGISKVELTTNQAIAACVPNDDLISLRYLFLLLIYKRQALIDLGQGGAQPNISQTIIKDFDVPVAPRHQQDAIVSKIDELFSDIEAGERALKRARRALERYRKSVLKAAVTGELTADWREANKDKLEPASTLLDRILTARREAWEALQLRKMKTKGTVPKSDAWKKKLKIDKPIEFDFLPPLPSGWVRSRVDTFGEVQLGRQRAPKHHDGEHMRPYLRVANVFEERIDISDVMSMNFTPAEFETYSLASGDILLNEGQSAELVGRPAIYRDELPGACFTNTLVRFRCTDVVETEYALLVFLHYMHSGYFTNIARITTNIAHLGADRFASMSFPCPPIDEQHEILTRTSYMLSKIAHVQEEVKRQERRTSALRQSVLKAAFSGQLRLTESLEAFEAA